MATRRRSKGTDVNSLTASVPILPLPGDPLVNGGGRVIEPDKLPPGFSDPVPVDTSAEDFRPLKRQNLDDLGAEPKVVTACGAVLSLTMLGIGDREICFALQINPTQLEKIRAHAVYADVFNAFVTELINSNSASLQARIASYAHGALTKVAHLAEKGKKEETQLTASRDLLDRAGTRARDQAAPERVGLRISIIGQDQSEIHVEQTIGGSSV